MTHRVYPGPYSYTVRTHTRMGGFNISVHSIPKQKCFPLHRYCARMFPVRLPQAIGVGHSAGVCLYSILFNRSCAVGTETSDLVDFHSTIIIYVDIATADWDSCFPLHFAKHNPNQNQETSSKSNKFPRACGLVAAVACLSDDQSTCCFRGLSLTSLVFSCLEKTRA